MCRSLAAKPGEAVAVLSKLHLEPPLVGVGVLRKDVEDEGNPINDVALERLMEVALLGR